MIVIIIIGLLAILFAYLAQYEKSKWGLKVTFILIFFFLALRYDFGRDYMGYYKIFESARNYSFVQLFDGTLYGEIGWLILCWLFKPFGFFAMIAFLALVNCVIYYRFIKKYVPVKYYWLAVFLYIFSPGLMLLHITAMRQSLAIALFLFSIEYLYKRDFICYFLIIGLASLFHTSAFVLFTIYLLVFLKDRISYKAIFIIILTIISLFFTVDFLKPFLKEFILENFERYENYTDLQGSARTLFGSVYYFFLLTLTLFSMRLWRRKTALIFKIYTMIFFIYPLSIVIMFFTRIGMYFEPFILITSAFIAFALSRKGSMFKYAFLVIVIIRTLYGFITSITSEDGILDYAIYQTILSAPTLN